MPSVQPLFIPLPPGHPAAPANDTTATATAADRDPVAHARMLMRRAVTAREVEADAYDDRSARYTRGVAGAIVVGALAALLAVTVDAWVFTAATGASGFFGLACLVAWQINDLQARAAYDRASERCHRCHATLMQLRAARGHIRPLVPSGELPTAE